MLHQCPDSRRLWSQVDIEIIRKLIFYCLLFYAYSLHLDCYFNSFGYELCKIAVLTFVFCITIGIGIAVFYEAYLEMLAKQTCKLRESLTLKLLYDDELLYS